MELLPNGVSTDGERRVAQSVGAVREVEVAGQGIDGEVAHTRNVRAVECNGLPGGGRGLGGGRRDGRAARRSPGPGRTQGASRSATSPAAPGARGARRARRAGQVEGHGRGGWTGKQRGCVDGFVALIDVKCQSSARVDDGGRGVDRSCGNG